MESTIICNSISKQFCEKIVLYKINLNINRGEIFGLLGPSGAGKTTLIKIITGQLIADSGTSSIGGINSQNLQGDDYKSYGIMMDDFGLYERLSCYNNLKIFARIYGIDDKRIYEVLDSVGLNYEAKKPASKLSKGMKIRLKLARVFLINPSILFLDEPTSGLDPSTASDIHQMIISEKQKGKTIFLTTHNMAEATKLCDNIALLNEGKIIEYGKPREICKKHYLKKRFVIELNDGKQIEIPHNEHTANTIYNLLKHNKIETIHSSEPNLEDIFMELTGRGILL